MSTIEDYQDARDIQTVLREHRTVAIVGLSSNELRASNFVGFYLKRHGYRIIPVNPREESVFGEKSYPSLLDIPHPVDCVDVFRDPSALPEIIDESKQIKARSLWLQFGVIDLECAAQARDFGMTVIMDRCIKIEHARFMGRMHWLGFNTGNIDARRTTVKP